MHIQTLFILSVLGFALAEPQIGRGKGKGKGKSGGSGLEGMAKSMGFDPNSEITAMVCKTFAENTSLGKSLGNMFGSANGKGPDEQCMVDRSGGSGPYKASFKGDDTLPVHTIYMPQKPPPEKLPVIVWGNGFCISAGTMFANFLNEIASHGFFIVANGPATGSQLAGQTTYKELIKTLDWLEKSPGAKKYNLDLAKIAVAGQSCGGLEAVCLDPVGQSMAIVY